MKTKQIQFQKYPPDDKSCTGVPAKCKAVDFASPTHLMVQTFNELGLFLV